MSTEPERLLEDENILIDRLVRGPLNNNIYILTRKDNGRQLIIDAADDAPGILDAARRVQRELGFEPSAPELVITTHRHQDHTGALAPLLQATGAKSAAGADDAAHLPADVDLALTHGQVLGTDGADSPIPLAIVGLRGHTPGSVAITYQRANGPAHIFTGDSLFPGGVGNTEHDPQRFASLISDVQTRLFNAYDDDTRIWPGHGAGTTLGAERDSLPQWRERGW